KSRCYLIGAMEFEKENSFNWRNFIKEKLSDRGILFLDPYQEMIANSEPETNEWRQKLKESRRENKLDYVSTEMRRVRQRDLFIVDNSDFIIFVFNRDGQTCGSW